MIQIENLSKMLGGVEVLAEASFRINDGERVGLVGANGSGKSTLFKLLTGEMSPDMGDIKLPTHTILGHLHQQLSIEDKERSILAHAENALPAVHEIETEMSSVENALQETDTTPEEKTRHLERLADLQAEFERLGGYDLRTRAQIALSGLGFNESDFYRPMHEFSGGWQMRAELARVLASPADILLLDEPTNYLDTPAVEWLERFLHDYRGTLVLISHDRYLLNALSSVTLELALGTITRYAGNYTYFLKQREERHQQMLAAYKNQERQRAQIERFIERFRYKASKASQVQSRVKMLEKMDKIQVPEVMLTGMKLNLPTPKRTGHEVIRIEDAGKTYDGKRWIFRHFQLTLNRGEKAAFVGPNGMGKTTLLRALAGQLALSEGTRKLGTHVTIGYQSQEFAETLNPNLTVYETARQSTREPSDGEIRSLLGCFRFSGNDAMNKPVSVLSGGEKMRLAMARILLQAPSLLILDEPTTHLDISSREALEEALRTYEGTLCVVSHDITFLSKIANTILHLTPDGIEHFSGDYAYFADKMAERQQLTRQNGTPSPDEPAPGKNKASAKNDATATEKENRKERKRREAEIRQELSKRRKPFDRKAAENERKLEELEEEQNTLTESMNDPSSDMAKISRRLGEIQKEMTEATEAWEEAMLAIEELESELPAKT